MHEEFEVKYWTKALGVDRERLQEAVDKVGNSGSSSSQGIDNLTPSGRHA
jgi:3-oxoacyl-[acyl-carrier-protein] synthase III